MTANHLSLLKPRIGMGVIIMRDNLVLLGKRINSHGHDTWGFPGGNLELNEGIAACAKREVLEETGLEVTKLYYGPYTNDVFTSEDKHYVTLFVLTYSENGAPKIMEPDKCKEWQWFQWHKLPKDLFLPIQNLQKQGFSPFKWNGTEIKVEALPASHLATPDK